MWTILVGTAGAGKTTLAKKLSESVFDVVKHVMDYQPDISTPEGYTNCIVDAYKDFANRLLHIRSGIIEIAPDVPETILPILIPVLEGYKMFIFVDTPLAVCLERNEQRDRVVPPFILLQQALFGKEYWRQVAKKYDADFLVY